MSGPSVTASPNVAEELNVPLHAVEDYLDTDEDTNHCALDFWNKVDVVRV